MAASISFYGFASDDDDDDFIHMELSPSPTAKFYYSSSNSSSPQSREFEFQMCFNCSDREAITSPADDLFYKGKLLPLYLPPRLEMVENISRGSPTATTTATATSMRFDFIAEQEFEDDDDDYYSMPFTDDRITCTNVTSSPLESANISPLESCRASCELGLDDYYLEWSTKSSSFIKSQPAKNSLWFKKLKIIKHSIFAGKLKASKEYLKSLFRKSGCSNDSCGKTNCNARRAKVVPKKEEDKHFKIAKKNKQIGQIDRKRIDNDFHSQRSSFSSAITQPSPNKCLSSSSSNSSSSSSSFSLSSSGGVPELHYVTRTSNAMDIEGSIEAAIAYCKKSQEIFGSKKASTGPGTCSMSASRIAGEEGEKGPAICIVG